MSENMLYRIRHDDCGTIFRYVTFEQTQKKKCPKCKQKLDSMKMATVGLEKSKQGVLV